MFNVSLCLRFLSIALSFSVNFTECMYVAWDMFCFALASSCALVASGMQNTVCIQSVDRIHRFYTFLLQTDHNIRQRLQSR